MNDDSATLHKERCDVQNRGGKMGLKDFPTALL